MENHRRSRIELYLDVLRAIKNGRQAPSKIVYAANLSYDRVIRCVEFLEEHELVEKIEVARKRYSITEKGKEILQYFEMVERQMPFQHVPAT